ncbi:FHA domain containing protein [Gloeothece citriformis PCC 7424]|uniref:FHA domain containing protein n=1 Tax=Gloeothece citriformis (strain PCC 7424) TaxID=65393 RepID=B7KCV4_GLOC7|nr:CHAT domain-containing protein [Gloeothece citriformis]ACK71655.1 FHA domain containing protein [Gloeothece citriformis PCC 7424]
MYNKATPCLSLAIARLNQAGPDNFAIWVIRSPLPGGYVHYDCIWPESLTRQWLTWQEMFSLQYEPHIPSFHRSADLLNQPALTFSTTEEGGYGGQLMQQLGISLWQWMFDGPIRQSLAQSRGVAFGKNQSLRVRLEIRDPNLVPLPWEIMQPEIGTQAISLSPQILFSRTTANVEPLQPQANRDSLHILLVVGEDINPPTLAPGIGLSSSYLSTQPDQTLSNTSYSLELQEEASALIQVIAQSNQVNGVNPPPSCASVKVDPLIQPTAIQLTEALDGGNYNVLFYAGHGMPGPDGGLLFLRSNAVMNGTELAQVLVRNRVTLALFNACWGAQPAQEGQRTIERSSLAEVLIHHGVPAVLGMRDAIADQEALSFIQAFTKALTQRMPIDQAVRIARQQLLTVYKFNQPAWTLPILYMHPEFDGKLLIKIDEGITELPVTQLDVSRETFPVAYLRLLSKKERISQIYGGLMRVGRHQENDLVIKERWVSQRHGEIICREQTSNAGNQYTYYLRDFSRFGTFIYDANNWQRVHHQEIPLTSGVRLKFGSLDGQIFEFIIENFNYSPVSPEDD